MALPLKPRRVFAGVALVSLCVLMLQLALTRLFSATMYYHFAFMAISLALFGSGASGVFVYLLGARLSPERGGRWLSGSALLFAFTTVAALLGVLGNPLSPEDGAVATLGRLTLVYTVTALPFFFAGAAVTLAVTRFASQMSGLYLLDLGGAAVGCLMAIPALDRLGAVNTVLLVSVLAWVAAVVFESSSSGAGAYRRVMVVAGLVLLALFAANTRARLLDVRRAKGLDERGNVIFARWNSFSRVTVWGSLYAPYLLIMIDADAATLVLWHGEDPSRRPYLAARVESLAYHLKPSADTLIIGPGGGIDVVAARALGAGRITAVEINPVIAVDVMSREPFLSYSGAIYEQPGVRLVVDEARSFIRSSAGRYDVIEAAMVDTWAATAAGAFTLTENNLYTVEAFQDYIAHLTPDGILSVTRWCLDPPDQLLRLASLTRAAMAELGIADAARRIMVVRGVSEAERNRAPATFLFKKSGFTEEEVRRVEAVAAQNGFELLYTPLARPATDLSRIIEAQDPRAVWSSLDLNVAPTRDNSPFFFHTVRLSRLGQALGTGKEWRKTNLGTLVLFALLALTTALSLAFILGPLVLFRGRELADQPSAKLRWLLGFAALGAGYILVEVALVQKCILFLGHPVYALSVVLFSLLAFSGLGSLLSGRFPENGLRAGLGRSLWVIVAIIPLYAALLSPVFYALVDLGRPLRIAITMTLLAPLGLALGFPMPTGIRLLAREEPRVVPWAWGVNGACSVTGSVAAVAIALAAGFNQALLVAAAAYVVAFVAFARVNTGRGERI